MTTVVITGGSSGIGLDIARAYTKEGANIILLARNQIRLDNAVSECRALVNTDRQKILSFSVDVTDHILLANTIEEIRSQIGAADILIISAGIVASKRFIEQSDEDFDAIMQTNVIGARAVARAFLPNMIERKTGQICFIGSLGGMISTYGYSAYSASKFAIIGMAGCMRQELAEYKVGVSVVCPPEVNTPMTSKESKHILPQTRFIKDVGGTLQPHTVTKATLKGIANNRFIIVPGVMAKLSYWQARVFPRTFAAFIQLLIRISSR
ncbi:SDR family NAD(P)-dependent oxidoreductase [Shewanella sp. D64]|uniref:SDR family NAD(P)-dependent oxidoreductase n=1 Tax=unclassified Shewanella TaxID=196818 RepID=UPI0022BA6914|nr:MULTISPECIES: SDR family NAD(P)-dependent oxidoreductase [unclassified Shewanella]MEC4725072.1 SDR family NAD(P)-dependent oxidoreductase [Shewanella sp. D64]MEC4736973.1 SDR family NAD(P)-dependent oxidoreductase [Shewanella sp. E94]WBJ96565.1 SDR family NAD(P)-dependent oxidoreductase [Shewanella sp. MTB7]